MSDKQAAKALNQSFEQIADNRYDITDYKSGSEASRGLAETHEQLSDAYVVAGANQADAVNEAASASEKEKSPSAAALPEDCVFDEDTQE
ncbi:hypothetical protein PAESOLCIP111_02808 [Paenibacillus solanacearum]|uniref:DUF4025 domain-containing protein n=1 Tax=Paenibacillus solanacearum TaxID=2048548 RepID=A0A916NPY1_9BACL|nr:YozQ family protein [Paenibacillus solanacearum]CAG7626228.1 hypothetical protein PAESOLCIP111_02808 [Paenibacillus solanacearum]